MGKKIDEADKYGFVYLWFDRKRSMFYVGCHWGTEDDGYVCSSNWMRHTYRRRPQDFKRRVIKRVYDRQELLNEEHRYLTMIKTEELRVRYYNLYRDMHTGHWAVDPEKRAGVSNKLKRPKSEEHKEKLRQANLGKTQSEETKAKKSTAMKEVWARGGEHITDEARAKMSEKAKARSYSSETRAAMRAAKLGTTRGFWWTNGSRNIQAFERPGEEWRRGKINRTTNAV